jgi:hypothetical protein
MQADISRSESDTLLAERICVQLPGRDVSILRADSYTIFEFGARARLGTGRGAWVITYSLCVLSIGKIKGLEELVIQGCYAKNWPAYLEERMSVRVQAAI